MTVTLITPTGLRPEAFALTEKYIARQTYKGSLQWLVIDDSPKEPTKCTMNQEYLIGPKEWKPGINTQRYNLDLALSKVKGDYVFIIEDDDWLHPSYIEVYLTFLKHCALVGECDVTYYSISQRSYRIMGNYEHASTCQTAFRKGAIPFFEKALHSGEKYFDIQLWANARAGSIRHILFSGMNLCVGIKGMPSGRPGIGVGHRPVDFTPDLDGVKLRQLVGLDYKNYEPFLGRPQL